MLILNHHIGEAIVIDLGGQQITVTVSAVSRRGVTLAYDAPDSVRITRTERPTNHGTEAAQ
jgi:carbon storage regulator CsrA